MKNRIKKFVKDNQSEMLAYGFGVGVGALIAHVGNRVTGVELINYADDTQAIYVYKANRTASKHVMIES